MNLDFWQGKRVFLTGHTGFKGAWMSRMLLRAGAVLTGYALDPPTKPNLFSLCEVEGRMRSIYGDALFRERGIQLELRAAKDLPAAAMPASALKQVLLNLFRNASEALLPGQRLVVSASSQVTVDGQASLEIRLVDNGPGLPPERAADLFASRTSAEGDRHQGVGLTLVREILSQWGATILCRSQASSGTSFQLFLPLEQSS